MRRRPVSGTAAPAPIAVTLPLKSYPNPFNPKTTLSFTLPQPQNIEVAIYDSNGRRVRTLLNEFREAGEHAITWNGIDDEGRALVSGVYYAHLTGDVALGSNKLILLK